MAASRLSFRLVVQRKKTKHENQARRENRKCLEMMIGIHTERDISPHLVSAVQMKLSTAFQEKIATV
jgi:hypothetical protein